MANDIPTSFVAARGNGDSVIFAVDGVFDGASAWDLRHAIEAVETSAKEVVVDFTRVREFYDFGVAVLAHTLAQRPKHQPPVALRGLRTHQQRMFRYFGVEAR